MKITIAYITNRKQPMAKWFFESLSNQLRGKHGFDVEVVIVDYYDTIKDSDDISLVYKNDRVVGVNFCGILPSYCQGSHRLTKENYFSATIARNTALVYASGDYIVFADDLSVLSPTWIDAVLEAATERYVVQGTYRKDKNMVIENGTIVSSEIFEAGKDHRMKFTRGQTKITGHPEWSYGCSIGMPLDIALEVNGYDELHSITGYEDCSFGIRLQKAGARFIFDTRMLTVESEEHHFSEGNYFKRIDPEVSHEEYLQVLSKFGIGKSNYNNIRWDASHAQLDIVQQSPSYRSHLNGYDLHRLRNKLNSFCEIEESDMNFPTSFWFNNVPFSEM